jgi:hypothetical protein
LYCGPHFSSLWDAENIRFGQPAFIKNNNLQQNKEKVFEYLKNCSENLTLFNFLGGEPLFQPEFLECLDFFAKHPAPKLKLQFFTNLNVKQEKLIFIVDKIKKLIAKKCIFKIEITASIDCWGAPQEYVRFPINLDLWEKNFNYLLNQPWINLIVNSTLTPLTIKTFPDLLEKINVWSKKRKIYHYQNSVNGLENQLIDIFGNINFKFETHERSWYDG